MRKWGSHSRGYFTRSLTVVEGVQALRMAVKVPDHYLSCLWLQESKTFSLDAFCYLYFLPLSPSYAYRPCELTWYWVFCNPTQVSMNATSLFCLLETILVLMSTHLSLSHTYSNNRCEPFKDGCIIVPKRMRLTSLGWAAKRLLIARGLSPFLRAWVKGSGTRETVPRHFSNPRITERRNSS